jgi:hypothetical protein
MDLSEQPLDQTAEREPLLVLQDSMDKRSPTCKRGMHPLRAVTSAKAMTDLVARFLHLFCGYRSQVPSQHLNQWTSLCASHAKLARKGPPVELLVMRSITNYSPRKILSRSLSIQNGHKWQLSPSG